MNIQKTKSYLKLTTPKCRYSGNMAMFDLDCTLIKPIKNKSPKKPYKEFTYCFSNSIQKLQEYSKNSYQIVIITNQKVLKTEQDKTDWIEKINKIHSELKIELIVYASLEDDVYRKPRTGFLEFIKPNSDSFYCGDALGRMNDFTDTDLKFAMNINIRCLSPEFVFKNDVEIDKNNVSNVLINYAPIYKLQYYKLFKYLNLDVTFEVIIMVGIQGSGKSFLSRWIKQQNSFWVYDIISRDTEGTMNKCLNRMENSLRSGFNIIIDNTNPTIQSRKPFIDLAKKYDYTVKIINIGKMCEDFNMASHNNYYRHIKFGIPLIPNVALYKFIKDYEQPSFSEGIDEIIHVEFFLPTVDLDYFKFYF